jgi:hypothetical protein
LLSALTLPVWTGFCIFNALFFAYFHNTAPDLFTGLLLTTAGAVGVMLPGTPGGIGTFEASVVAALSLVNMDKSEALAFALVLHLVQVIPAVLYAVYAALRGQWSLSGLRAPLPEDEGAGSGAARCAGNTDEETGAGAMRCTGNTDEEAGAGVAPCAGNPTAHVS